MTNDNTKWAGKPLYDRPLGLDTANTDDGRTVIWLTDFGQCQPAEHLEQWALVDFANREFSGQLLHAPRDRPAPELTLNLNAAGWYAVYVWLMGGDAKVPNYAPDCDSVYAMSRGPALKLSNDKYFQSTFSTLSQDQMFWRGLESCFWQYADLTDQQLTIRHNGSTIYLGAIQLIPLAPAEVEAIQHDRDNPQHKRLIQKGDTYSESDRQLFYQAVKNRDLCAWIAGCHRTADLFTPGGAPSLKRLRQDTRELGIEAYACDRPGAWSSYHHSDDQRVTDFNQNPDWHCLDRDGTHTHHASYAHPEVQDYMLRRARAAAETGIDGYGYFLCRDPGLILFEPAAMEGFEARHGVDPLTLDDRDERLQNWRADILTRFMRRLRALLDQVAQEKGFDRIKIVHVVLGDRAANQFFSFDVETWVAEGLIDVMCPYPWADYEDRWLAQAFVETDVKYFTDLCQAADCKVFPMWVTGTPGLYSWVAEHVRPNEYFNKALADYQNGADGISTWDAMGLAWFYPFMANRWLRLGHQEQLALWDEHDFPLPAKLRFTRYNGKTPDRYPAGTGG
ncbi:MAG: hypothetical protein CMJ49_13895 [Planctomycetaceae bacterium]|nr:hypothetical protein [Planctomycetaceae bacterium]